MERVKRRTQLLFPPSILGFYHRLKSSLIMGTKIRKPSHAGSWYTDNRKSLKNKNFDWSNFADQIQKMGFFFPPFQLAFLFYSCNWGWWLMFEFFGSLFTLLHVSESKISLWYFSLCFFFSILFFQLSSFQKNWKDGWNRVVWPSLLMYGE